MKKVLLLPSYLGGGFGHIGRCLALAADLKGRGWEPAFALGGFHAEKVVKAGYPVYPLSRPFAPRRESSEGPAFTVFSDLSYQLVRDGLISPGAIRACLVEQLKVVNSFSPDLLVSDSWPLARLLAHLAGLPLVQIVRSATHPEAPNLIWWEEVPDGLVPPDPRPVFNPVMKSLGLPPIERAEDLLRGDLYLVPSFPELDPLPNFLPDNHYVGPLTRSNMPGQAVPLWLDEFIGDWPLVYITLGGGAGPVGGPQFYRRLFCALGDAPVRVVSSTGSRLSPSDLPAPPDNFRLESWVPGPALIARSSLVIFPGGYGTTMELVQAGVPGIVIPFHTEQESNGKRLETAGAARVLRPVEGEPYQVVRSWPGGSYSYQVYQHNDLTAPVISSMVLELLENVQYKHNAQRLKNEAAHYGGAAQAGDLIETLVFSRKPTPVKGWDRLNWWQKIKLSVFARNTSHLPPLSRRSP
jgi:UDP:flavonoid glycosyltransferase YjiC (YdhE family)